MLSLRPFLTPSTEDYYVTIYSAEIVNTLTNLLFIALGVKGIRNCLRYGHDTIFLVAFIGYVMVGSGSFAFHSTLKCEYLESLWRILRLTRIPDPMQLVDEVCTPEYPFLLNLLSLSSFP
jgi:hypothetical protein